MDGPSALIGAGNFVELAVATAVSFYGVHSGAALATVVGVLIEVPVSVWKTLLPSPTPIGLHWAIHAPGTLVIPNQAVVPNQLKELAEAALRKTLRELCQ